MVTQAMKDWLGALRGEAWKGDLFAGISVALVLIPQALAYAPLAGLPPVVGLYAAAVAPIAASFFVSSPCLQTGPVATTSVLCFGTLVVLATPGSEQYLRLAALLALVVGVIRILIGLTKAGFVSYLMSEPVLLGFSSAVALLILASQLPATLGIEGTGAGILGHLLQALASPEDWHVASILFSLLTLLLVVAGRMRAPSIPWVLIALLLSLALSAALGYEGPVLGQIEAGFPMASLSLPWSSLHSLLIPGAVIALVGFAEAAAISRTMAARTRTVWNADQEFISQGVANLAAGLFGTMPVGGSFSRSALIHAAGGRTRRGGLVTGLTVLLFLPFAGMLSALPSAVLAAIVISSVARLIDLRSMIALFRISRAQAAVGAATFFATLVLSPRVDLAIFVGITAGVAVHLWRERRIIINREVEGNVLRLQPVGVLYFGSAPALEDALVSELAQNPQAEELIIDLRKVGRIDYSSALILRRVVTQAEEIGLVVKVIPGQPPQGERILRQVFGKDARCLDRNASTNPGEGSDNST